MIAMWAGRRAGLTSRASASSGEPGGIDASNIRAYAEAGVDFVSVGAVTHSAAAVDINFRIVAV